MSSAAASYPFTAAPGVSGEAGYQPLLPLTLAHDGATLALSGLLDTGASVNVLPWAAGVQLGLDWEQQTVAISLTGNLSQRPARAVVLSVTVDTFAPVRLAFAWTQAENLPLILGQVNFFLEFDVCFFRARRVFEVTPKQPANAP